MKYSKKFNIFEIFFGIAQTYTLSKARQKFTKLYNDYTINFLEFLLDTSTVPVDVGNERHNMKKMINFSQLVQQISGLFWGYFSTEKFKTDKN